ncbi:MAG: tetratricopeptide repeat protein [Gemmatimonadota bacterium]
MFGLFKKKKPANALDEFIFAVYGNPPPPKRANLEEAITLAADKLLMGVVQVKEVRRQAVALNSGPIPYSTHDLALSVALNFFKQPEYVPHLGDVQMMARLQAVQWLQQALVVPVLVKSFEDVLYELYAPVSTGTLEDVRAAVARGDHETALRLVRPLADQGNTTAQYNLGVMYEHGEGAPRDYAEAAKWYRKAAEQGHPTAQYNLGVMCAEGQGVPRDYVQAHKWFTLAVARFPASDTKKRISAIKNRDIAATKMTSAQTAEAERLVREWKPK